jgi:2-methylisocitrate lyase-like PEP mutase family enzyme
MVTATARLRQLIQAPEIAVLPGAYDAVSAELVERAGFSAIYFSGGLSASAFPGVPDFGIRTLTEAVAQVGGAVMATSMPVLADGEAGFGSVLSVQRLIREMERVGAAGLHLEDQDGARRCGHYAGKQLVSATEHAGRIRAAVAARKDPNFLIIARTDAIAVTNFDDAVRRSRIYAEAGADMIFADGIETMEQLRDLPKLSSVPVMANMVEGGKTPFLNSADLQRLGYALVIFPISAYLASIKAMAEVLDTLRRTGSTEEAWSRMGTFQQWQELTGVEEAFTILQQYGRMGEQPEATAATSSAD